MHYDANGNLIIDRDRKIKKIAYNYLNLPDTMYLNHGNLIVNNYDASGKKYKSIYNKVRKILKLKSRPFDEEHNKTIR